MAFTSASKCSKFNSRDGDYIDLRSSDRKEERTSIFNGAAEPGRRNANGAKYDSQGKREARRPWFSGIN
jgi:hypothetical protein